MLDGHHGVGSHSICALRRPKLSSGVGRATVLAPMKMIPLKAVTVPGVRFLLKY
jgi:hypothetical protein